MEKLNKSAVVFDSKAHTYTLDGKRLSGVTAIVKWLFPDTYKDIPQSVLDKAAEYGSLVHSKCELWDAIGAGDDIEPVKDYIALKEQHKLETICSEYLVDDGGSIASSIDKVYSQDPDGTYPLADIKTTSNIHERNVGLQLSIYATLFERQNPDKRAGRLLVVWLPKPQYGQAKVMEVRRLSADACWDIMHGYLSKDDPTEYREKYFGESDAAGELELKEETLPATLADVESQIIDLEKTLKDAKAKQDKLKEGLFELMIQHGVKKWQSERLQIVRKLDSTREALDSTKLKKKYPEIYDECKKVSTVKGSITIKVL